MEGELAYASHPAADRSDVKAAVVLLKAQADPNVQDARGTCCLHTAAKRGDIDVVQVLLEHGADSHVQDYGGQSAAHLMPLWPHSVTVKLFDLLAPPVLLLENEAGIAVAERLQTWAMTACAGQPYEPIQSRLKLLMKAEEPRSRRPSRIAKSVQDLVPLVRRSGSRSYCLETSSSSCINVWEPLDEAPRICALYLCMPHALPWSMLRPSVEALASVVSTQFGARVLVISYETLHPPLQGCTLPEYQAELLKLIAELPLWDPFVLIDNTTGIGTALLWPLRDRLAGAMVINSAGFFAEDFVDSSAYRHLSQTFLQIAGEYRKDRDIEKCSKTLGPGAG